MIIMPGFVMLVFLAAAVWDLGKEYRDVFVWTDLMQLNA